MKKQIFLVIKRIVRRKRSNWTKEQDSLLLQAANLTKHKRWLLASKLIKEKTPFQCHMRFKLLNPNLKKGKWTVEEDTKLIGLVAIFGKSWNIISKIFKNRSNKQVMNRYEEYLNNAEDFEDYFSEAEDQVIIQNYPQFGKKWNLYVNVLKNRSSKKIKKRFFLLLKAKRICLKSCSSSGFSSAFSATEDSDHQPVYGFSPQTTTTQNELFQSQSF